MPHTKGLSENCKNICSKHDIHMHFKGGRTIGDLLVNLTDRDIILQKSGVIYRYKCGRVDCEDQNKGESGRMFAERFKEHMKDPHKITPQVMLYPLIISALWGGRNRTLPHQSKKSSLSESMMHP